LYTVEWLEARKGTMEAVEVLEILGWG